MSDAIDPAAYVATVDTLYVELPDTPLLRLKLRQAAGALPANVQKSTFSDDH